jgi:hypothetical protein
MSATGGANRPPRFLRWANARLTRGLERGRAPTFMRLLTVRGRVTGEPHATPVVPVIRDGDVWVVSPYGEVAWVRNVRRATQLELRRGDERTLYKGARTRGARSDAGVAGVPHDAHPWGRTPPLQCHETFVRRCDRGRSRSAPSLCAHTGVVRLSIGSYERQGQPRAQIGCSACITQRWLRANGLYPNDGYRARRASSRKA